MIHNQNDNSHSTCRGMRMPSPIHRHKPTKPIIHQTRNSHETNPSSCAPSYSDTINYSVTLFYGNFFKPNGKMRNCYGIIGMLHDDYS